VPRSLIDEGGLAALGASGVWLFAPGSFPCLVGGAGCVSWAAFAAVHHPRRVGVDVAQGSLRWR